MRVEKILKCQVCDTTIEVLDQQGLGLVCCGRPMVQAAPPAGAVAEHTPKLLRRRPGRLEVALAGHAMTSRHRIEWVEIAGVGRRHRVYLRAGEKPIAVFDSPQAPTEVTIFCSRHGLCRFLRAGLGDTLALAEEVSQPAGSQHGKAVPPTVQKAVPPVLPARR